MYYKNSVLFFEKGTVKEIPCDKKTYIKSHFTVCNDAVTVVMPTGTGKTETMLAYIVSEKIEKTLSDMKKLYKLLILL